LTFFFIFFARLGGFLFGLFKNKFFLIFLILINFFAGIYSISYYFSQLEQTNWFFWLFVIDCPLYAIIFGLNIFFILKNKPSESLSFISIVGNFKYGFWTLFILTLSGLEGMLWLVFLSHILLVVETIVLFGLFAFKVKHVLLALIWFLVNDFVDYFLGMHPFVLDKFVYYAMSFAFVSTIISPFLLSIIFSSKKRINNDKSIKNKFCKLL
jgi:uncharacterized membrane protein YpjA